MFMTVICLAPDQTTARRVVAAAHALDFPLRYVEMLPDPTPLPTEDGTEVLNLRSDPEFAALLATLGLGARGASLATWSAAPQADSPEVASLTALLGSWGLPEHDAERYGGRVAEGAVFIAIHAEPARMRAAHEVLASHGGEEIADTDLGHAERIRVRDVAAAPATRAGGH